MTLFVIPLRYLKISQNIKCIKKKSENTKIIILDTNISKQYEYIKKLIWNKKIKNKKILLKYKNKHTLNTQRYSFYIRS
jgi:hypothetical protein